MRFYTKICNYVQQKGDTIGHCLFVIFLFLYALEEYYLNFPEQETKHFGDPYGIFSEELLANYNGITEEKLYLAVLGSVFDVSKGAKYYAKGGSYHYFVGKDGSRSLITGDFSDESANKDNVIDLTCTDLDNLLNWKTTFHEKYDHVGVLIGRYYDKYGKESVYYKELYHRLNECEDNKKAKKEQDKRYPPCNIAWSADEGSKVWCTRTSGGISRDWVGVPRQMYTPGKDQPHCVCVNFDRETPTALMQFKKYDDCHETSTACTVIIK